MLEGLNLPAANLAVTDSDCDPVDHAAFKRLEPTKSRPMYALAINFDYDADRFWERLYSLGTAALPGELVPMVTEYWEHTLPMTRGRLARVQSWLAALPDWQGTDDYTRPATALVRGECHECEVCSGTGVRGFSCACSMHSEDCEPKKCRECCGTGFHVV